jgi:hypothetical protein
MTSEVSLASWVERNSPGKSRRIAFAAQIAALGIAGAVRHNGYFSVKVVHYAWVVARLCAGPIVLDGLLSAEETNH